MLAGNGSALSLAPQPVTRGTQWPLVVGDDRQLELGELAAQSWTTSPAGSAGDAVPVGVRHVAGQQRAHSRDQPRKMSPSDLSRGVPVAVDGDVGQVGELAEHALAHSAEHQRVVRPGHRRTTVRFTTRRPDEVERGNGRMPSRCRQHASQSVQVGQHHSVFVGRLCGTAKSWPHRVVPSSPTTRRSGIACRLPS